MARRPCRLLLLAAAALGAAGCAELGNLPDAGSASIGRTNRGALRGGVALPDAGEGFATKDIWKARGRRYATEELADLLVGVGRRMRAAGAPSRLIVADLSQQGGGPVSQEHRSHQSGRDADLLYFVRDAGGASIEPDAMRVFDARGAAVDGSGLTVDVPRTWLLVRELVTAPEATVQYVFLYEPLARRLLEHARRHGEPAAVIARARQALVQPGDSAPHNDHLHVRVYCSERDRRAGCVDAGAHVDDRPERAPMALASLPELVRGQVLAALAARGGARLPGAVPVGAARPAGP